MRCAHPARPLYSVICTLIHKCKVTTRSTPIDIYCHLAFQKWAKNKLLTNSHSIPYKRGIFFKIWQQPSKRNTIDRRECHSEIQPSPYQSIEIPSCLTCYRDAIIWRLYVHLKSRMDSSLLSPHYSLFTTPTCSKRDTWHVTKNRAKVTNCAYPLYLYI